MSVHDFSGPIFVSQSGAEELTSLRVNSTVKPTGERAPIEMLARLPSEECGCPEEVWSIEGIILLFHFEPDGTSDAFIFAGDLELENHFVARDLHDLRAKSFQWFADVIK